MPYTAPETVDVIPEYRPSALRNIMGQSWFPYLCFFMGLAVFALGAAFTEFVLKRQNLQNLHQQILATVPVVGQRNAPVQVLEFTDFGCTFCSEQYFQLRQDLAPQIQQGQVAVFLLNLGKLADTGQQASRFEYCVAKQDPFHHPAFLTGLFQHNQGEITPALLQTQYQNTGGTRLPQIETCLNSADAKGYQDLQRTFVERLKVMGVKVSYGDVAVQNHLLRDLRNLKDAVQHAAAHQGKLPAALLKGSRSLY